MPSFPKALFLYFSSHAVFPSYSLWGSFNGGPDVAGRIETVPFHYLFVYIEGRVLDPHAGEFIFLEENYMWQFIHF